MKYSKDWYEGFTVAMVWLHDIFKSRTNALYARGVRKRDVRMILAIIDAAFMARKKMSEIGPRAMDLILHSDGTAEFIERIPKE